MPKESKQENRPENESENVISEVDDIDMLLEDLSVENNPEYRRNAIEALEKVIRYQESLEVRKGFKENELIALRKKLKEWHYEKDKNKKQLSNLSFFGLND
ncbi:28803_t:CDS:2 [Racocetra persica]|uniref:28803_t:CDS:1 n=1 Tax=Racocetra persica TaxID=160502 RepID=A0ACA9LWT3_9GLOM|nr:28803_t:CDS:2 [Racocetra persica]